MTVYFGDNLEILTGLSDNVYDLIYADPPFNTGNKQELHGLSYVDTFDDYLGFLVPRLEQAYRVLKPQGSLFLHCDYHEVHYIKVELDKIFGRNSFQNHIIWAYDYGSRSKNKWSCKHDDILWYSKDPKHYTYNYSSIDLIPKMAPSLPVSKSNPNPPGTKVPTDVWWSSIVGTMSAERTGYPTQKPKKILNRIIKVHSNPSDHLLDMFAGSGTFGLSAIMLNRTVDFIDANPDSIKLINQQLNELTI